jgi:tetratricopeptide (TPR) repeat protein
MYSTKRFMIGLRILLVCLFAAALGFLPEPVLVRNAVQAADQARARNTPEAAAAELRHVVELQPWRSDVWQAMGTDLLAAGKTRAAIEAFQEARNQGGLTPAGQIEIGTAYQMAGDCPSAIQEWGELVRKGKQTPDAFAEIFRLQKACSDLSGALETLQAWSGLDANNAVLIYQKGLVRLAQHPGNGLPEELLAAAQVNASYTLKVNGLQRAANISSQSKNTAYQALVVGRAFGNLGEWDLAKINFESAVQLSPAYAEAWAFLGEAKQQLHQSGYDELSKAAKLNPNSVVVQALFSIYWRRQGRPGLALDYLKGLIAREPDQAIWQIEAGNTAASSGNLVEALAYFQRAVAVEPQNGQSWQALARFSLDYLVNIEGVGLPAAREALQLSPEDPAALDLMGALLLKMGDLLSAERFLQRALSVDISYASVHLHLGQLYIQSNKLDLALEHLNKAERLAGDQSEGVIARRLKEQHFPGS